MRGKILNVHHNLNYNPKQTLHKVLQKGHRLAFTEKWRNLKPRSYNSLFETKWELKQNPPNKRNLREREEKKSRVMPERGWSYGLHLRESG